MSKYKPLAAFGHGSQFRSPEALNDCTSVVAGESLKKCSGVFSDQARLQLGPAGPFSVRPEGRFRKSASGMSCQEIEQKRIKRSRPGTLASPPLPFEATKSGCLARRSARRSGPATPASTFLQRAQCKGRHVSKAKICKILHPPGFRGFPARIGSSSVAEVRGPVVSLPGHHSKASFHIISYHFIHLLLLYRPTGCGENVRAIVRWPWTTGKATPPCLNTRAGVVLGPSIT